MIFETTRDGALKKLDDFIENEIIKENIFDEIMEDLDYGMCATTREYFENVGTVNGLDFTEDFDKIVEIMVEETFEMSAYEG